VTINVADIRETIVDAVADLSAAGEMPTRMSVAHVIFIEWGVALDQMRIGREMEALAGQHRIRQIRAASGRRAAVYALSEDEMRSRGIDVPADDVTAPDFKPGYPSMGGKIGPAWQAMWLRMADGAWHDAVDLGGVGAEAGDCLPGTARNLLFPAAKEGLVEVEARYDEGTRRWRSWYRRPR